MIQVEFTSDLSLLDYLELFQSTTTASSLLGISQSSCSRRYRAFSEQCGLAFDRVDSQYRAHANLDVLQSLRLASQRIRVRSQELRVVRGWQLGRQALPALEAMGHELPVRLMNSWRLLSLLEKRLIDVAVMSVFEFRHLLNQPSSRLHIKRYALSQEVMCIPMFCWDWQLLTSVDSDLLNRKDLNPDVLIQHPSPALELGASPLLMTALQRHGLGSHPVALKVYEEQQWEGFAAAKEHISYAAPWNRHAVTKSYGLESLHYATDITDCMAVVGHRDVLSEPSFEHMMKQLFAESKALFNGQVQWLT